MSEDEDATVVSLEAAIAAVPGVARLYAAGDLVARAAAAIGDAFGRSGDGTPLVAVGADRIAIRLGVDPARPAAEVCRDAYAVARAWATQHGRVGATVEVTVAAIEGAG